MKHLMINLLITVLAIGIVGVRAQHVADQVAQETRPARPALQVVEPPKFVASKPTYNASMQQQFVPLAPKHAPIVYHKQKPAYHKQLKPSNVPQKYTKVIPLNGHQRPPSQASAQYYPPKQPHHLHGKQQPPRPSPQLVFSASTGRPFYANVQNIQIVKSPKFSLPVQTINGIRATIVKPPKSIPSTTTTTTTTTTERPKRVKRIWPKHILEKMNGTLSKNSTSNETNDSTANTSANTSDNLVSAASSRQNKYAHRTGLSTSSTTTTTTQAAPRVYRRVTRKPKIPTSTEKPGFNMTANDWVPIMPSHYPQTQRVAPAPAAGHPRRRSDRELDLEPPTAADKRRQVYLQTYGIVPLKQVGVAPKRKLVKYRKRKRNPNSSLPGLSGRLVRPYSAGGRVKGTIVTDLETGVSRPRVVTKIKHHHHHHHHKYVRTVEKPVKVPVRVEVPKPYPVEKKVPVPVEKIVQKIVEKRVPYPVAVEKKVPYKVEVKVPQPFPVKVVQKEYVAKPYPVVQHVPVVKHVEVKVPYPVGVPVHVEKKVPYPVHVKVPVDRPVPYPVPVEKKVPVPYPVKVFVPQPYAVEKRVPYPVEVKVKEPYPVVQRVEVPVKVYVPKPYPVKVPHPVRVEVEKRVPYPVEVEKKVPVPVKVYVPQPYQVEKKVPVYITKHVAVPMVGAPSGYGGAYSRQNSVQVITAGPGDETVVSAGVTVEDGTVTAAPQHTVTVHGNGHFSGFSDRSDAPTTPAPAAAT